VLELRIGAHSHGQGMETTWRRWRTRCSASDPENVRLVHGDTGTTPYSTGTWGSRSMVMSGGAVAAACEVIGNRVKPLPQSFWKYRRRDLILENGSVSVAGTDKKMSLAEVAHVWYRKPQLLPADVDPAGLEATAGYKAKVDTGTFSYACHATTGCGGHRERATWRSSTMSWWKTAARWSTR
jgi:carbon-monoxide dehydrogenase large subunit